jgi:hypothetical protein
MNNLENGAPLPKSIGACADLYKQVQTLRLAMDKEVEAVKARETEIKDYIIANLSKSEDTGAAGKFYRAQIVEKTKARVADWGVFTSWVKKNDRFDCLQKRLSDTAVADTMEKEERVLPGLELVIIKDVSITKI